MIANSLLIALFAYGIYKITSSTNSRSNVNYDLIMLHERAKQASLFRQNMLYTFGRKVLDCMPSYDTMLHSKKHLVAAEWIDVDKLTSFDWEVGSELDLRPYQPIKKIFINPN